MNQTKLLVFLVGAAAAVSHAQTLNNLNIVPRPQIGGYSTPGSILLGGDTLVDTADGEIRLPHAPRSVVSGLTCFGDSITTDPYAPNSAFTAYCALLKGYVHGSYHNYATSGFHSIDVELAEIYPNVSPVNAYNPISLLMAGTNDLTAYGADPNRQQNYVGAMESSAAWLAIPRAFKVFGQDSTSGLNSVGTSVCTGSWAADNTHRTGMAIESDVHGDSCTVTITTTGGPIYVN